MSASVYPVKVGCRGLLGTFTRILKNLGVVGPRLKRAFKELTAEAAQVSFWL